MQSNQYSYLNIYRDKNLTDTLPTDAIKSMLSSLLELKTDGEFGFKNRDDFPFIRVSLLYVKSINSWNSDNTDEKRTNFIAIECDKHYFKQARKTFNQLAQNLDWNLTEEE